MLSAGPAWAENVDGRYKGTFSNTGQCVGGGPTELVIKDRAFTRTFGPNARFDVSVGPDGRFSSQYGQATLSGAVKNGHVDITISGGRTTCVSSQTLDKT